MIERTRRTQAALRLSFASPFVSTSVELPRVRGAEALGGADAITPR